MQAVLCRALARSPVPPEVPAIGRLEELLELPELRGSGEERS